MATPVQTPFQLHDLSDAESLAAFDLTNLSVIALKNLRANAAISRLNLAVDPKDFNGFLQQEAYLKGQMDAVTFILDAVEATQQQKLNQQN